MSSDFIWQPGTDLRWLNAFAIPGLPWVKTFLELMKFSPALVPFTHIFEDIHAKAVEKYALLWDANQGLGYLPELDTAITREFVTEGLAQIAVVVNPEAAEAFKLWAYRNIVSHNIITGFICWRMNLFDACHKANSIYASTLPKCLLPLLPQIENLLRYDPDDKITKDLMRLSPPYEDIDCLGLDMCPEAMIVDQIIGNQAVRVALRYVMDTLSESEFKEVLTWIEAKEDKSEFEMEYLLSASNDLRLNSQ